jgi:hypothetical protein
MDGAMYTKDGSMGEMGLRRCIVMAGNDFAIEMDKKGCVWPMQASYRVVKGGDGVEYCIHYPDSRHQDIIPLLKRSTNHSGPKKKYVSAISSQPMKQPYWVPARVC